MSTIERRNELARARGFRNYSEQRRFNRRIRNHDELVALPPRAQQSRDDALSAVAVARREQIPLAVAARREGTSAQAVQFWVGDSVRRQDGEWLVSPSDRLYRAMLIHTTDGSVEVAVRGSRKATVVGQYHSAVGRFINTGDPSGLEAFNGVTVDGHQLETDPDALEQLFRRGSFNFDSIYRLEW